MSIKPILFPFSGSKDSKLPLILLALLLTQIISIGCIFAVRKLSANIEQAPLLNFDPKKVTKIAFEDKTKTPSKLTLLMNSRSDWLLPETYEFPASGELVHKTLDALAELKKGYALATTTESQERYRVGDRNYLQKICLFEGEKEVARLLIGKPLEGANCALRSANDSAICSGIIPCSRGATESDYWIDKRAATVKVKNIALIDMGKFSLENFDENWRVVAGKRAELFSFKSLRSFVYPIANCKIISVCGNKPDPDFGLGAPLLSFKIVMRDGEERKYVVAKAKKSDSYVIKISNLPWYCVPYQPDIDIIKAASFENLRNLEVASKKERSNIDLKAMLQKTRSEVEQSADLIESNQIAK